SSTSSCLPSGWWRSARTRPRYTGSGTPGVRPRASIAKAGFSRPPARLGAMPLIAAALVLTPLLLSAPGLSAGGPGNLDPCLERYRQGHRLLGAGDLALARAQFESVPADCILADYAAFFAAESLLRFGDEGVALDRFRAFVDRFPDSTLVPSAVLALADTSFRLCRWAAAEREARRFLQLPPSDPAADPHLAR